MNAIVTNIKDLEAVPLRIAESATLLGANGVVFTLGGAGNNVTEVMLAIHRAELHDVLRKALPESALHTDAEVTAVSTDPANDQTYGAKWITDLSLAYHFPNGLSVTGGADNIFNVFPDQTIAANSSGGIFMYSGFSPFGYNGAFYYLRLSVGL